MTRISTGTVSIGNGETIFTLWDGDDDVVLSEITAPAQSAVVIEGVANFIKTRLSTSSAELVLPHSGAGGAGLACAISALTPAETQIGTLNARTARVIQELETVEANGRGLFYRFSDTTTDADPGAGYLRFNQLDLTTATAAYVDVLDANGGAVSGEIDTWDDSTSLAKGNLWVRSIADPTAFRAYSVTGSVVDGTGYRKLTLTHIGGSGSFAADDELMVAFARTGDIGEGYVTDATVADPSELTALEGEDAGYLVFVTDLQTDFGAYSGRSGVVELIAGPDWELVAVYTGPKGDMGDQGDKGWSPQIVVVSDGTRRVHQLAGYVGGAGTAPTANVGEYLKADGTFTATIGEAADVRGPAGLNGSGTVASVEAGAGIAVDNADPTAPVVSLVNDGTTNAKLANMATATIKGRATAGTGDPEDLTVAQAQALLSMPRKLLQKTAVASGGTSAVFLNLGSHRFLTLRGWMVPLVAAPIGLRFSTDSGATWISTSSYRRAGIGVQGSNSPANIVSTDVYFYLNSIANQASGEIADFELLIDNVAGGRIGVHNRCHSISAADGTKVLTTSFCDTTFIGPIGALQITTPGTTFGCDLVLEAVI